MTTGVIWHCRWPRGWIIQHYKNK